MTHNAGHTIPATQRRRTKRAKAVFALAVGLLACPLLASDGPAELHRRFQELSVDTYRPMADNCGQQATAPGRSGALSPRALGCALREFETTDPNQLQALVPALLERELVEVVEAKLEQPDVQSQPAARTQLQFYLGQHAFERGQWQRAQQWLEPLGGRYSLTGEQRQYLKLVEALELQRRGEHREAIKRYERFEPDSAHYAEARTNLAIAYIRQDWWTDAHREIKQLLDRPLAGEFKNRLRVLFGLSQLQQGFYRDARETFRAIELDSEYSAHGWRGIGLSALHQGDFSGALNAFVRLRDADRPGLPEGHFLVAFAYDQMGELTMAEASYTEAILDYQNQLNQLGRTLSRIEAEDWLPQESAWKQAAENAPIEAQTIEALDQTASNNLEQQYRALEQLRASIPDATQYNETHRRISVLLTDYRRALAEHYRHRLTQRQETLESYLSQSQYGLATIYDRQ